MLSAAVVVIVAARLSYDATNLHGRTEELVYTAAKTGFRSFDFDAEDVRAVGNGLKRSGVPPEDLILQVKFTPQVGGAKEAEQLLRQSLIYVESTLNVTLMRTNIDVAFLTTEWTGIQGMENLYRSLEKHTKKGFIKKIGLADFDVANIVQLTEAVTIKPSIVQGRILSAEFMGTLDMFDREGISTQVHGGVHDMAQILTQMGAGRSIQFGRRAREVGKTPRQIVVSYIMAKGPAVFVQPTVEQMDEMLRVERMRALDADSIALCDNILLEYKNLRERFYSSHAAKPTATMEQHARAKVRELLAQTKQGGHV